MGSPGAGKTLLARAVPGILPAMSTEGSLDVTRMYSVADQLPAGTPLIKHRPFRAPHHTISHAGLVGGGNIPKPGEISLAHRGVLFLDEFPEFGTRVQAARDTQRVRFSKLDAKHPIFCNADMRVGEIRQFCRLQDEGQSLMRAATSCCA